MPAIGVLAGVLERTSRAAVPSDMAKGTASAAARISAGEALAGAVPAAVAGLVGFVSRRMIVKQYWMIAGLIALGVATTGGAVVMATSGEEPKATPRPEEQKPATKAVAVHPEPPLADKLDRLKAEYEGAHRAFMAFYRGSTIPEADMEKALKAQPDFPALVRRILDLASTAKKDPAVRDAMLWVIRQSHRDGGEFALAADWLLRAFGDDPEAIRVGLELDNWPTAQRDQLLLGFYASAKGRESKGLARLALAMYLESKAKMADGAREVKDRPIYTHDDLVRADGTLYTEKEVMPDQEYAYVLHLKQCDLSYLRDEAERLYEEVIAEYGDLTYITARDRMLETLLKQPEPQWRGKPLGDEDRRQMEAGIARRRSTLGQVAEARLDDWHNLAVGKSAPEIKGADVHGKALALSDYRGKVVALVFWGTWCGPCMREVPREKALVERMKARPFAMLGDHSDADAGVARKVMEAEGITGPTGTTGPRTGVNAKSTTSGDIRPSMSSTPRTRSARRGRMARRSVNSSRRSRPGRRPP